MGVDPLSEGGSTGGSGMMGVSVDVVVVGALSIGDVSKSSTGAGGVVI
jgi:hypothetical protein